MASTFAVQSLTQQTTQHIVFLSAYLKTGHPPASESSLTNQIPKATWCFICLLGFFPECQSQCDVNTLPRATKKHSLMMWLIITLSSYGCLHWWYQRSDRCYEGAEDPLLHWSSGFKYYNPKFYILQQKYVKQRLLYSSDLTTTWEMEAIQKVFACSFHSQIRWMHTWGGTLCHVILKSQHEGSQWKKTAIRIGAKQIPRCSRP